MHLAINKNNVVVNFDGSDESAAVCVDVHQIIFGPCAYMYVKLRNMLRVSGEERVNEYPVSAVPCKLYLFVYVVPWDVVGHRRGNGELSDESACLSFGSFDTAVETVV